MPCLQAEKWMKWFPMLFVLWPLGPRWLNIEGGSFTVFLEQQIMKNHYGNTDRLWREAGSGTIDKEPLPQRLKEVTGFKSKWHIDGTTNGVSKLDLKWLSLNQKSKFSLISEFIQQIFVEQWCICQQFARQGNIKISKASWFPISWNLKSDKYFNKLW